MVKFLGSWLALVLLLTGLTISAAATDPALQVENATVNLAVDNGYSWSYSSALSDNDHVAYIAGNSYKATASVSNLAITVSGAGKLTFDYKLSTPSTGDSYALYYQLETPITSGNYKSATNYVSYSSYRGVKDWQTQSISISQSDLDSHGQATVYVAYYRNGANTSNDNYVAIANIKYDSSQKTLTVADNAAYAGNGTVTVQVGDTTATGFGSWTATPGAAVTLTATPNAGAQFYGWVNTTTNELLSTDKEYTFKFSDSMNVQAMFAPANTYTARWNGTFYTGDNGLVTALGNARSGDTVVMLEDQALTSNTTVPEGVFLLIPCMDNDAGYETDSKGMTHSPNGKTYTKATGEEGTLYRTLTVPKGVTLTVEGQMLVNAVVGRPVAGHYDQDITGGYGLVTLNGEIVVSNGGYLENYGYILGTGQVTANSGSTVVDLYVVRNWRGGSQAYNMILGKTGAVNVDENEALQTDESQADITTGTSVYPMNENDCHNIQTTVVIASGASFQGAVKMYAADSYYYTRFPQIDDTNGLIRLDAGAVATKTYDAATDHTTITITGGATFSKSSLTIVGVVMSTGDYLYPIDHDISLVLESGNYVVAERFKLLTGSSIEVKGDATLTINATSTKTKSSGETVMYGVGLVLYDQFNDVSNAGTTYGSYAAATLTLDPGAQMTVNGSFAGQIVLGAGATVDNYATVTFADGSKTTMTSYEANGYYSSANPTKVALTFQAQLVNGTKTTTAATGNTYYGIDTGWQRGTPTKLPGDLNGNGTVDFDDLSTLLKNYNKAATAKEGDINGTGTVDFDDLSTLLKNYNKSIN